MNKHKKFIKDCYEGKNGTMCQDWKNKILEHYPEFKQEGFKVGDWIYDDTVDFVTVERIYKIEGNKAFCNTNANPECDGYYYFSRIKRKATPEEVQSHLIAEAKKRGYNDGISIKCIEGAIGTIGKFGEIRNFWYSQSADRLNAEFGNYSYTVYSKGQWAEIIKTMSKEDAEKKLGCKIV